MTAALVQSILAAGIEHPELIQCWQQHPGILRDYGIEPDSIDLVALGKFAGLTVKVRHNGLREALPSSFRLMNVAGLEIEVFATYATHVAVEQRQYAATLEARTSELINFLQHWLDLSRRDHALLWDMIRHEWALDQLGREHPTAHPETKARTLAVGDGSLSRRAVPHVCGAMIIHEMRCDPTAAQIELRSSAPRLDSLPLGTRFFCYWRADDTPEVQILELDEFGYYVLSVVDGVRTISEISHKLGGGRRPSQDFLQALSELASVGILDFARAE